MIRFIVGCVFALLVIACAKDDSAIRDEQISEVPFAISILATQGATDFQLDLSKEGVLQAPVNLFQRLELPETVDEVIVRDSFISFHAWLRNNYSSHQINIDTDEVLINRNYCFDENNFEVLGIINSQNYLAYVSASLETSGATIFHLNVYDQDTSECQTTIIPSIAFPSNYSANGDYFALFQQDSFGKRELLVYDMKDLSLDTITLDANFNFSVIGDEDLYIFKRDGSYQALNLETLDISDAGSNSVFENPLTGGVLDLEIKDNKMAFFVLNPQPSTILSSPLIYNFETDQVIGDGSALFKLIDELESNLQLPVTLNTFEIELKSEQIVVGYSYFEGDNSKGGVVYIDFDGNIVFNREFDFVPNSILVRTN